MRRRRRSINSILSDLARPKKPPGSTWTEEDKQNHRESRFNQKNLFEGMLEYHSEANEPQQHQPDDKDTIWKSSFLHDLRCCADRYYNETFHKLKRDRHTNPDPIPHPARLPESNEGPNMLERSVVSNFRSD